MGKMEIIKIMPTCWDAARFGNNVDMEDNQEENSQTKKLERINFRVF